MPAQVRRLTPAGLAVGSIGLLAFGLFLILLSLVLGQAKAQEAPAVQLDSFWGATVELPATGPFTREITTTCPAGEYALPGGWDLRGPGAADVRITGSYLSRAGEGGAWTLTVTRTAGRPQAVSITPYGSCAAGVGQVPG